jgi:DNA repair photolyase
MRVLEVKAKSALNRSGMVELDYAFNAYLGCAHGCRYCYAADITPGESASTWGDSVRVRVNIIAILQSEIKSKRRGLVGISTITDPYQPIEAKYRLSRQAIALLLANGFRVSIQTKSPLVLRDLDILRGKKSVDAGVSLATTDKDISRLIDRKSPLPDARIRTLRELSRNGIKTWMFLGPIIPGINDSDESIEAPILVASEFNIRVIYDLLNPYSGARSMLGASLGNNWSSSMKTLDRRKWWENRESTILNLARRYNVECNSEASELIAETGILYKPLY